MPDNRPCPRCGSDLPDDLLEGLCPKCVVRFSLELADAASSSTGPFGTVISSPSPGAQPPRLRYFGDYELLEEIARGGMGVVYKARQASLNRIVAVKMILAGQLARPEDVQRFHAEAEAAANLKHPNIVAIHEVGEQEGQHYFSMDFIEGQSLADLVRDGPLPAPRAARYVQIIAKAIEYAHQRGTLHRDLKPSNVLIDAQDEPQVTDFGLAKQMKRDSDVTLTGQILGSPNYMPPEQATATHAQLGPHSDVYSLGAILYHLLAGRPPFVAGTVHETLVQVVSAEPVSPKLLNASVPGDVQTICLKCLAKEPSRRYQSAQECADELGRFLRHEPICARPPTVWDRVAKWTKRRPAVAAMSAAILVSILTGVGGVVWQWRQAEAARVMATARAEEEAKAKDEAWRAQQAEAIARGKEAGERRKAEQAEATTKTALQAESAQRKLAEYESYVARIALAALKIDTREFAAAEELLEACPSELRHWEWGRLKRLCHPEIRTFYGRARLSISADGARVFTANYGGGDNVRTFWDAATGERLLKFSKSGNANVDRALFSPDGQRALLLRQFGEAGLWDLAAGKELFTYRTNLGLVRSLAFSPDGGRVLLGSQDGWAKMLEIPSGRELFTLKTTGTDKPANVAKDVADLTFSPDGKRVATGGEYSVQIWDAETGQEVFRLREARRLRMHVRYSPDGKLIFASGGEDGILWDAATGKKLVTLKGHTDGLTAIAFSPDSRSVVTASQDQTVRLWDAASGTNRLILKGHTGQVRSAVFSPHGRRVVTASDDRTARIWDAASGRELRILAGHSAPVIEVVFTPDGKQILTRSEDKTAKLWSAEGSGETVVLRVAPREIIHAAFSPDSRQVLTTDGRADAKPFPQRAQLWSTATAQVLHAFPWNRNTFLNRATFSSDGTTIIATGPYLTSGIKESIIDLWDATTGKSLSPLPALTNGWDVMAITPDAKRLYAAKNSEAFIWDLTTGRKVSSLQDFKAHSLGGARFSLDGRRLVTWYGYGERRDPVLHSKLMEEKLFPGAKVWEVETGSELGTLKYYMDSFESPVFVPDHRRLLTFGFSSGSIWDMDTGNRLGQVAAGAGLFSPDSQRYFTTTYDGETRILDFASGQVLFSHRGHREEAFVTSLSPDGKRFLTSSIDGTAKLWDADTGRELLTFKTTIGKQAHPIFSPDGRQILMVVDGSALILVATDWKQVAAPPQK